MKRFILFISAFLTVFTFSSCGSVMKMVGDVAGSLLTGKTNDLNTAAVQVFYMRNIYPQETGVAETDYFKDNWKEEGNMVFVSMLNKSGVGMLTIDGKVTIDGTEVPHIKNGFYGKWIEKSDLSPKKAVLETTTGQRVEFTVSPPPPIKILSVNGKSSNMEVSIEKDLVLELQAPNVEPGTEIKIALVTDVMGIDVFTDVGIFKYKDKIRIPAAMWKNPLTAIAPKTGKNWLKVERYNLNLNRVGGVGATQVVQTALDCVPVTLSGELDETFFGTIDEQGIQIKEEMNGFNVQLSKPNAFLGKPFSKAKKFAMASFSVRATKLQQSRTSVRTSTSYTATHKITTTTTTTRTKTFPKLPEAYWDNLVAKLYKDVMGVLNKNYNIQLIPMERVLNAPSYAALEPISDNVSIVEVEKSYKGTKNLIPTTLSAIYNNMSSTFASDRIDSRLIRELDVDGLIAVTVDLEMDWEGALSPRMSIRISGAPNGYIAGPTIYAQGVISGKGTTLDTAKMDAQGLMDVLPKVIRQKDLINAFSNSIKTLKSEEKKQAYEALWSLK